MTAPKLGLFSHEAIRTFLEELAASSGETLDTYSGFDVVKMCIQLQSELATVTAQRDGWVDVHKADIALGDAMGDDDEALNREEKEELQRAEHAMEDAIELAHKLDPRHRCPVCKGHGGSLGANYGFVPCPECDGNDWAECLAEGESDPAISKTETTEPATAESDCHHDELGSCHGDCPRGAWCEDCQSCICDIVREKSAAEAGQS